MCEIRGLLGEFIVWTKILAVALIYCVKCIVARDISKVCSDNKHIEIFDQIAVANEMHMGWNGNSVFISIHFL